MLAVLNSLPLIGPLLSFLGALPSLGALIPVLIVMNICLGVLHRILDEIKNKTEAKWDNKLADIVASILGVTSFILDLVGGSRWRKVKKSVKDTE